MIDDSLKIIWEKLNDNIKNNGGDAGLQQLLRNSRPISLQDNNLLIFVPNQLMKKIFVSKLTQIKPIIRGIVNKDVILTIESLEMEQNEQITINPPEKKIKNFETNLNEKFTFKNFVIGNNTRLVYAAAKRIVEMPGKIYNPLFIYGKPGLGKTHIIQAIGNRLLEDNPNIKILYITTEAFTNDLINAIRHQTTDTFHNKYRELDCLIIDDIQQLKGKERTQEEFFNTFNSLEGSGKQIIIASDRIPQEIETLQDRITSRLTKGFMGDIQQPDYETRLAILELKLEERNVAINDDCKNLIATKIKTDIRVMESVCNRLQVLSEIGEKITPDITMQELQRFVPNANSGPSINFEKILDIVTEYFGVTKEEILSKKRNAKINFPRQIIMYLTRKYTNLSLSQIGKELGGKDHSTIIHGYEKINEALESKDEKISSVIELMITKLN